MKKLLLLILCNFSVVIFAQNFWTEVAPFNNDINFIPKEISIVDNNVVWVSSNHHTNAFNTIAKWSRSEDGGITWTTGYIDLGNSSRYVSNFKAISNTTAYVSVFSSNPSVSKGVWATFDAGVTWTQQTSTEFSNAESFVNFLHFFDTNNAVVIGDAINGTFEIYTSNNGGTTWNSVLPTNIPQTLDSSEYAYTNLFYADQSTIWFGTNYGRIFKSNDNGLNWIASQSPIYDFSSGNIQGNFAFKNQFNGILIDNEFNFWRTTDGGFTWNTENPTGITRNPFITYVPQTANTYFQYGIDSNYENGSSYSTDGGLNWLNLNIIDINPVIPKTVSFKSGTIGFCIGKYSSDGFTDSDKLFKLTDPLARLNGTLSITNFTKNKITASPNPTNGIVKISGNSFNAISIYDISGKQVFSKNYDNLSETQLDISTFENGIYFAKISNEKDEVNSVKIIKN